MLSLFIFFTTTLLPKFCWWSFCRCRSFLSSAMMGVCFNPEKLELVERITSSVPVYVLLERLITNWVLKLINHLHLFCQLITERSKNDSLFRNWLRPLISLASWCVVWLMHWLLMCVWRHPGGDQHWQHQDCRQCCAVWDCSHRITHQVRERPQGERPDASFHTI